MCTRSLLRPAWLALLVLLVSVAAPASAAEGTIDHVEPGEKSVSVLYSVPSDNPDLTTVAVTIDGTPVEATAELAAEAGDAETVRRTAILAIDVSKSMQGERFAKAKAAARDFLSAVSDDVYVGIVAFAGDVASVQEPTRDRTETAAVLDTLTLSLQTRLYDGVRQALAATGGEGQRTVLVLSDGRDTSETSLEDTVAAVQDAGARVDVVALAQGPAGQGPLEAIAEAGRGDVLTADDPDALAAVFSAEAEALARQLLVTAELPTNLDSQEGTLAVSVQAESETYTSQAFVTLSTAQPASAAPSAPTSSPPGMAVSKNVMLGGLAAAGVGVLLMLLAAFGVLRPAGKATVEDRVAAYTRNPTPGAHLVSSGTAPSSSASVTQSAVGAAERALSSNAGLAASIGDRLEAAGMSLKPAEWVLIHAGIAVGSGILGFLLGGGSALGMLLLLLVGAMAPWLYLGFKRSRRLNAFNGQLADTLQLISGALSAGLSLAQGLDTVVRQGAEPVKTEFRRALVEARLGVSIEDALESIADRMESQDFRWVVIAIRIQREVGGNLSEVLGQVSATIRERNYLHRQVKSLSAEGRMSAWILGLLPVGVFGFVSMMQPTYFQPMFETPLGLMMLGAAGTSMIIAAVWMRKLIRIEV